MIITWLSILCLSIFIGASLLNLWCSWWYIEYCISSLKEKQKLYREMRRLEQELEYERDKKCPHDLAIECPHCHWRYPWKNDDINQGWMLTKCPYCNSMFYYKLTINDIRVETSTDINNHPVYTKHKEI